MLCDVVKEWTNYMLAFLALTNVAPINSPDGTNDDEKDKWAHRLKCA